MKIIFGILCFMLIISCNQSDNGSIAYRITEQDLIPEGITFSEATNSFYVSSILKTKIIQIEAESGEVRDFITPDILRMRFLGMIVDESRKQLWACGNLAKDGEYYSAVARFDINSGELLKSYINTDSTENIYNDLVQDKAGNVYFTNTSKQTVCKIDKITESLTVFFDSEEVLHPNGITISPDNKYLYIASTEMGIRVLDIESQEIMNVPDSTINSTGLDGLKYYENSIIGLQNEVRDRSERKIARYYLDESGSKITEMKIIDQNNPFFDIPTTFVIVGNELFCLANSQMGNVNWATYEIRSFEALDDNLILKYDVRCR